MRISWLLGLTVAEGMTALARLDKTGLVASETVGGSLLTGSGTNRGGEKSGAGSAAAVLDASSMTGAGGSACAAATG